VFNYTATIKFLFGEAMGSISILFWFSNMKITTGTHLPGPLSN